MDKLLAVADSENTLSCECDNVSRLKSLEYITPYACNNDGTIIHIEGK